MRITHLQLTDFRSYATAQVEFGEGVTTLVGRNGHGKTNVVEAVRYLSTLSSHRVATDAPLLRVGAERAVVAGRVQRGERSLMLEITLVPGRANQARLNRGAVRPRELLGLLRTVVFAPEDLGLVKGDPSTRRAFLDELCVALQPAFAGDLADYDRVLRQRSSLLKSAKGKARIDEDLLAIWDEKLAGLGGRIMKARVIAVEQLGPYVARAYADVAPGEGACSIAYSTATLVSRETTGQHAPETEAPHVEHRTTPVTADANPASSETTETGIFAPRPLAAGDATERVAPTPLTSVDELTEALLSRMRDLRKQELDRGVCLVGPHRDDLDIQIGTLPAKGYASHGESWSCALSLRLGSYDLLASDGNDGEPVLILDDVFAELDTGRRAALAGRIARASQVLITAAVAEDVPVELRAHPAGHRILKVTPGEVALEDDHE
ncbi:DNA replication/repair protein RecF [Demequina lutea]|uniref:DNA replication and repair protein RecF n=1 Tax=Demequina lutea TaxID=431489 RepID=A0A7Y9Z6Z4_9MICO|nr:DNA replication/repair protein RecF [Demequina lutea]NYI39952.1 DNA replication and repair protein RecF [Demequina lutea]